MNFETILYTADGPIATITLNRPDHLNTIIPPMPDEFESAINLAVRDPSIKVIVLRGGWTRVLCRLRFWRWIPPMGREHYNKRSMGFGQGFCLGDSTRIGADTEIYEHVACAQARDRSGSWLVRRRWQRYGVMRRYRHCQRGRADRNPLCPHVGCYLSGMWIYRLGLTKAKEYALTGKPLSGREAAEVGLINRAVPFAHLEETVREAARQLASMPLSQLAAMKLVVNQAYENMGLGSTQILGPILDGLMRNTPDAIDFIRRTEKEGVRATIAARDGPFGDYSQAPEDERPDPNNVIRV